MARELEGKVAVVTGAVSGIGLASTEAMLAGGSRVVNLNVNVVMKNVHDVRPHKRPAAWSLASPAQSSKRAWEHPRSPKALKIGRASVYRALSQSNASDIVGFFGCRRHP